MHRFGNQNKAHKKGLALITKFTRYNTRKKVFMNKRKFKGTNISATESLTSLRMTKLTLFVPGCFRVPYVLGRGAHIDPPSL